MTCRYYATGFDVPVKTANSDYCYSSCKSLYSTCGYPGFPSTREPCGALQRKDSVNVVPIYKIGVLPLATTNCCGGYGNAVVSSCRDKTCMEAIKPI